MGPTDINDRRVYAWQYFLAHAQARLTTFRFYLIFCTILCAGLFTIVGQQGLPQAAAPLAFILAFLSFVYSKVDQRHRDIVGRARQALIFLEEQTGLPAVGSEPHPLNLFSREAAIKRERTPFIRSLNPARFLTYSQCVKLVFVVFGWGGVLAGIALLLEWR